MKIPNKEAFLLVGILLIGLFLRLYKISNPVADWHSWRQADTAAVSRNYLKNGIDLFHPKFDDISNVPSGLENPEGYRFVEFPLGNALHASIVKLVPIFNFEVWGRLLSVFYSIMSLLVLFLLVDIYVSRSAALLSTFVLAVMPFNIFYSRVILPEPLIIMMSLITLYTSSLYLKKPSKLHAIFTIASLAILLLLKAYMAIFIIPLALMTLGKKENFKKIAWLLIIAFIPFALWFMWARQFPEGIPHFKWAFNGDHIRFRPAFFYWIFGVRFGTLILGVWGIGLFLQGLLEIFEKKMMFIIYWLLAILLYVTLLATGNVRHDYYQAIASPVFAVVVAIGFLSLWKKSIPSKILAIFSLFLMLLVGAQNIKGYYQINNPSIVSAGKRADEILPKDALVIAAYNGDTAFLYHVNRKGWPYVTHPINELIEKGASYYISVNLDTQTKEFVEKFNTVIQTNEFIILDLKSPRNL
jgi:hypothetical protein